MRPVGVPADDDGAGVALDDLTVLALRTGSDVLPDNAAEVAKAELGRAVADDGAVGAADRGARTAGRIP